MYANVKSFCSLPENNKILTINYISIKKNFFNCMHGMKKQCSSIQPELVFSFDLALERWNPGHSATWAGGGAVTPSGHFY